MGATSWKVPFKSKEEQEKVSQMEKQIAKPSGEEEITKTPEEEILNLKAQGTSSKQSFGWEPSCSFPSLNLWNLKKHSK